MVNVIAKGNQNKKLYSTKRKFEKIQKSYVQKNVFFTYEVQILILNKF
jgi:hypothetical protein